MFSSGLTFLSYLLPACPLPHFCLLIPLPLPLSTHSTLQTSHPSCSLLAQSVPVPITAAHWIGHTPHPKLLVQPNSVISIPQKSLSPCFSFHPTMPRSSSLTRVYFNILLSLNQCPGLGFAPSAFELGGFLLNLHECSQ